MMYKFICGMLLLLILGGCGSLSDAYVQERLAEEGLTVTSIHALAADKKVAFVEDADEQGCVLLAGKDTNVFFSRAVRAIPLEAEAPASIYVTFDPDLSATTIVCILIQDQTLQNHVASIEIVYPSHTTQKAVEPGQNQQLLTVAGESDVLGFEKVTFFDAQGRILHTEFGETP